MKPEQKLQGGSKSEVTRLKELWRFSLPDASKDYWRSLFLGKQSQAATRAELLQKLGINLLYDSQLNDFRKWEMDQRERELEEERRQEDERQLQVEHSDWTLEQIREETLKRSYNRVLAKGDFKLGLATVKQHTRVRAQQHEEAKFKESIRTKLEAGLAELAAHIKGNPKAREAFEVFKATCGEATK